VDDTVFLRRQPFGWSHAAVLWAVGKQENCRVAVSVSLAHADQSSCDLQLYLPKSGQRCATTSESRRAGRSRFQTKPEIALAQIRSLVNEDVRVV